MDCILSVYCNKDTEKLIDIREIVSFITRREKKETNPAVLNVVYEMTVDIHLKSGTIITAKYDDNVAKAISTWEDYVRLSYDYEMSKY
jgi:hypothetical protein|tara:strand:+ start:1411 stop:1674 length:264 start_codon:yes stop_codon:yes gene_type:complete